MSPEPIHSKNLSPQQPLVFHHHVYKQIKELGKGAFSQVVLAQNKYTGELVAVKLARVFDPEVARYLEQEILNQRTLKHPHVIEFREVFAVGQWVGIAMEYAAGGSLFSLVQREGFLSERKARWFFQQLCLTVDFCHARHVAHRDIKLENLLLKPVPGVPLPLLKMADFGFSKAVDQAAGGNAPHSRVGTLAYMAPEVISTTGAYDAQLTDVWSCGVALYVMLCGTYPFGVPDGNGRGRKAVTQRIIAGDFGFPSDVGLSDEVVDLLHRILQPNPAKRPSIRQVMAHPWFLENLPTGALEYNNSLLQQPVNEALLQPVLDIQLALDSVWAAANISAQKC